VKTANVREDASTASAIVAILGEGDQIVLKNVSGEWYLADVSEALNIRWLDHNYQFNWGWVHSGTLRITSGDPKTLSEYGK